MLKGKWREFQQGGRRPRALGQLAGGSFLVLSLCSLSGTLSPNAFAGLWAELGLGLWSAWIAGAAVACTDFALRFRLRPWIVRPGFWAAYAAGLLMGPMSPVIIGGFLAALLAVAVGMHVALMRLPLAAIALGLFILCTLRATSSIRVLTRTGGMPAMRLCGFALAFGLAGWNELARGLLPMEWLGEAMHAPPAQALSAALILALLLATLTLADGWLMRWDLLRGRSERRRSSLGALLLGTGEGPARAMRRAAILSWDAGQWAAAACGAVFSFPFYFAFEPRQIGPGVGLFWLAFALMLPCWARGNMLGADGPATWRYLCAGTGPSAVLEQRGAAFSLLQVLVLSPSLSIDLVLRPSGWAGVVGGLCFIVASIAGMDAGGMVLSRVLPEPNRPSDESGGLTTGGGWLWLGVILWDTAFVVGFVFAWPSLAEWFWPAAAAIACLTARWLVVRHMRRDSSNVWSARTLSRLGATWV